MPSNLFRSGGPSSSFSRLGSSWRSDGRYNQYFFFDCRFLVFSMNPTLAVIPENVSFSVGTKFKGFC